MERGTDPKYTGVRYQHLRFRFFVDVQDDLRVAPSLIQYGLAGRQESSDSVMITRLSNTLNYHVLLYIPLGFRGSW